VWQKISFAHCYLVLSQKASFLQWLFWPDWSDTTFRHSLHWRHKQMFVFYLSMFVKFPTHCQNTAGNSFSTIVILARNIWTATKNKETNWNGSNTNSQ
jgi:hypothetical protein